MARVLGKPSIDVELIIALNEREARALDALVGYGIDNFIGAFYRELGRSYMHPHEEGLRSLFKTVGEVTPGILRRTEAAREAFRAPAPPPDDDEAAGS